MKAIGYYGVYSMGMAPLQKSYCGIKARTHGCVIKPKCLARQACH